MRHYEIIDKRYTQAELDAMSEDKYNSEVFTFSVCYRHMELDKPLTGTFTITGLTDKMDAFREANRLLHTPVYKNTAEYAIEHDELPAYRESFRVNMACRDALETAIHENYHDYCLDTGKAAAQVAAQFGIERMAYVLANTVRAFDHDGRISRDNKAWAQTIPVCTDSDEWGHERSRYFLVSQVNPGLVNLLVSRVREELANEKAAGTGAMTMARNRNVQIIFWVSENEKSMIEEKMAQAGMTNLSAYLRRIAIDGMIVRLELPELKEMVSLLRYASNNINQIARRMNESGRIYDTDLEQVVQNQEQLWDMANGILMRLAAIK